MRLVGEILDGAKTTGIAVMVGASCPGWLAGLAETDASPLCEAPKLVLVGSRGLLQSTHKMNDWVLVVLEQGMAQLAPALAAQELASHSLQVIEVFLVPPHAADDAEPGQPECLVLARAVGQPLSQDPLDLWSPEPRPQTLAELLMEGNRSKLQVIAVGQQLNNVAMQRDAALGDAKQLATQVEEVAGKIDQLKIQAQQLRQDWAEQVNSLRTQLMEQQQQVRALESQSTLQLIRRRTGEAVRRLPGGGTLTRFLSRG